jgi:hypothetical protein
MRSPIGTELSLARPGLGEDCRLEASRQVEELDPRRTGEELLSCLEERLHVLICLVLLERGPRLVELAEDSRFRRALDLVAGIDQRSRLANPDQREALVDQIIEGGTGTGCRSNRTTRANIAGTPGLDGRLHPTG